MLNRLKQMKLHYEQLAENRLPGGHGGYERMA